MEGGHPRAKRYSSLRNLLGNSSPKKEKEKERERAPAPAMPDPSTLVVHQGIRSGAPISKLQKLLKKVESVDVDDEKRQTPLHVAAALGKCDVIKFLLKKGALVNRRDMNGWTALHHAACETQLQACITLLAVPGVDVKVDNHERTSVLHYLVRQRPQQEDSDLYVSVLREVADKGIDINTRNKHGEAPLHSACMKGNETAIKFLLDRGADVNLETDLGETVLHYGVRLGQVRIVQLLMDHGADATISSSEGQTAIDVAQEYRMPDILELLANCIKQQMKDADHDAPTETADEDKTARDDDSASQSEDESSPGEVGGDSPPGDKESDENSTMMKQRRFRVRSHSTTSLVSKAHRSTSFKDVRAAEMSGSRKVIEKEGPLFVLQETVWIEAFVSLKDGILSAYDMENTMNLFSFQIKGAQVNVLASQGEATINGQCHPLCAFVVAQDGCDITFGYPEGDPGGPEWHLNLKRAATAGLLQRRLSTMYEKLRDIESPRRRQREVARKQALENVAEGSKRLAIVIKSIENAGGRNQGLLEEFLLSHTACAAATLYQVVTIDDESFIDSLVTFFEEHNRMIDLLKHAMSHEINRTRSSSTLFREMGLATKIFQIYTKRTRGQEYLKVVLKSVIDEIADRNDCLEVNPKKNAERDGKSISVKDSVLRVLDLSQRVVENTTSNVDACPVEFREAMRHAQSRINDLYPVMSQAIVGGFVFLRFICPALVAPQLYGLRSEPVGGNAQRTLILISKILISLANGVAFDGSKEDYMVNFNSFLEKNRIVVQIFYEQLTNAEGIKVAHTRRDSFKNLMAEPDPNVINFTVMNMCSHLIANKNKVNQAKRIKRQTSKKLKRHEKPESFPDVRAVVTDSETETALDFRMHKFQDNTRRCSEPIVKPRRKRSSADDCRSPLVDSSPKASSKRKKRGQRRRHREAAEESVADDMYCPSETFTSDISLEEDLNFDLKAPKKKTMLIRRTSATDPTTLIQDAVIPVFPSCGESGGNEEEGDAKSIEDGRGGSPEPTSRGDSATCPSPHDEVEERSEEAEGDDETVPEAPSPSPVVEDEGCAPLYQPQVNGTSEETIEGTGTSDEASPAATEPAKTESLLESKEPSTTGSQNVDGMQLECSGGTETPPNSHVTVLEDCDSRIETNAPNAAENGQTVVQADIENRRCPTEVVENGSPNDREKTPPELDLCPTESDLQADDEACSNGVSLQADDQEGELVLADGNPEKLEEGKGGDRAETEKENSTAEAEREGGGGSGGSSYPEYCPDNAFVEEKKAVVEQPAFEVEATSAT